MSALETVVSLTVNGRAHVCSAGEPTVSRIIDELALAGKRIAVEVNGMIVPRSAYPTTRLADGDRVEIVGAVGGG